MGTRPDYPMQEEPCTSCARRRSYRIGGTNDRRREEGEGRRRQAFSRGRAAPSYGHKELYFFRILLLSITPALVARASNAS
jgi:hypothetical protein